MLRATLLVASLAVSMLAGCEKPAATSAAPAPAEVSAEAVGHYCGMLLADHEGPKGQIYLGSRTEPVWFSSVRDTIAFLRLPEEARDVSAIYVNDMAKARHWDKPDRGAWVDARAAWFVVESDLRGGMGAPEAVPFSEKSAAEAFRDKHGGELARLDDIPDSYVLGPVDLPPQASPAHPDSSPH
ncbi:MAG: nitrous oxide reductase accessory protein NosL [Gammaproteobacteria bacterium]